MYALTIGYLEINGGSCHHYGAGVKSKNEIAFHITLMEIVCRSCHTTKINVWGVVQMGDRGSSGVRPRDRAFRELGE